MSQRKNFKRNFKCLDLTENENMTYQNLWDETKALLRGKIIALNTHIKEEETSKINYLNFHSRKLENKGQINSKLSRRKEIIRI